MRLTTRTNLAMRILMYCAVNRDHLNRSADIAKACNASINHLVQVVPALHKSGFVVATRGRSGGVSLARPTDDIVVGEVFRIFESGLPFTECFAPEKNSCPLTEHCRLRHAIRAALDAFYAELDRITLTDLVNGNTGLNDLLCHDAITGFGCPGPTPSSPAPH